MEDLLETLDLSLGCWFRKSRTKVAKASRTTARAFSLEAARAQALLGVASRRLALEALVVALVVVGVLVLVVIFVVTIIGDFLAAIGRRSRCA